MQETAQDIAQLGFYHLQRQRIHSLSGQLVLVRLSVTGTVLA